MPYSHEDHPFKLKHGFVAWATALVLVMFGYNTVVPLLNVVDASVEQQTLSAPAPLVEEVPIIEENALVAPEEPSEEELFLEENLELSGDIEEETPTLEKLPTITP